MSHYRSDVRDLTFALFEVLRVQDRLGSAPFEEVDRATADHLLAGLDDLARTVLADSLADGDRNPPVFHPERHEVTLPDSVTHAVSALVKGGWDRIAVGPELGGPGLPPTLSWACAELILGANPVLYFYVGGKISAQLVHRHGTPEQRVWAQMFAERDWGSTMVLTEPEVGSDVGATRTRAVLQPDGSWHVEGVKRFITAAAQGGMTENIVHLVLARPEGPGVETRPGTKGLGLFLVPARHFDPETGEPGARNGVFVTGVEHKMGLKASTTCELSFGRDGVPAVGRLLGDRVNGMAQMFEAISYARMMVGTKAIATLSTAYRNALAYASERVQGPDLAESLDRNAVRVPILRHPDVRRVLLTLKAYAEGMRGVYLYTASLQDLMAAPDGSAEAGDAAAVHELLLPVVKGFGSERSWHLLADALQVFGGSGYLQDFPLEQYIRDAKVDTLYEGTTAIQSMDFLFRKIVRDGGQAFGALTGRIEATAEAEGDARLVEARAALGRAVADVRGVLDALWTRLGAAAEDPAALYGVGRHSVRFLHAVGELVTGWRLVVHAETAAAALAAGSAPADSAFYEGKITAARFFASTVLPELAVHRGVVEAEEDGLMTLADAGF
ncbi:acyl-CoA dehydrogenase [Streptomyces sp. P6-2-1]|uniref:acyl-CoA dehydrogenase n=1 Tax=unclassified Streptomyces TaxID=2593676 RepID=UPI003D36458A